MTSAEDEYADSWRYLRRWYALSWALFIGYLPAFGTVAALLPRDTPDPIFFGLFILYAGSWIAATNIARRFRCPRCGQRFVGDPWIVHTPMPFTTSCRSCGLPKYVPASQPS